ncbi:MAG: ABC transporter permease [Ignavibacteria bacterium]|nr:ABC transporter permease [Ignavibacteria bacterium]MBK7157435.1 ABC transporter permease [Ignavibacteria bacterium]
MELLNSIISLTFFAQVLRLMTPFYLGASAANFSERGGVINIAIEGFMNLSAFSFALFSILTGSITAGFILAIIVNLLFSLLYSFFTVNLKINQIVTGVGFNLLIAGITKFLLVLVFKSSSNTERFEGLPDLNLFKSVPFLDIVFSDYLTIFCFALIFISGFVLFKTKYGLRLRSVGENPWAAESLGIRVRIYKLSGILISGFLSSLAGIWLASNQNSYSDGMIAGRGYIAIAAMIIGKWKPVNIFFACLIFSAFEALEISLQISGTDIPTQLIQMLPYLITIIVLLGFVGKTKPPNADGIPY